MFYGLLVLICFGGVFASGIGVATDDKKPYILEDLINSTIEDIRSQIPNNFHLDEYDITLPDDGILNGTASVANLEVDGLEDFQLKALSFNIIGFEVNFTISFPNITLYTDYNADIIIANSLPVKGDGSIGVSIETLEIQANTKVNLTDGLSVSDLHFQLYLGKATFDIKGLYDDEELSELITSILNDLVVKLIDENPALISDLLSPIIEGLINTLLGLLSTSST